MKSKMNQECKVQFLFFMCWSKDHFLKEIKWYGLPVQEAPQIDDKIAPRICENLSHFDWLRSMKNFAHTHKRN